MKMRNYTVYFEIYGKKMKTTVMANNEEEAKDFVKNKIVFYKIENPKDEFNQSMDMMEGILNFLDPK
jgi:1-deoxy-D-xylulose 5-phosphate reductoisomerase